MSSQNEIIISIFCVSYVTLYSKLTANYIPNFVTFFLGN